MTLSRFLLLIVPTAGAVASAQASVALPISRLDPADTVHSPITPKRAFLMSLMLPGSAQNILGRHRAAAGILAVEATSIAMIRESGADLRETRQQLGDSVVVSYVDANGELLPTPKLERRRFEDVEVRSRRSHVEDWVALLIANHLFAACDAFVSASLWDVPAHVGLLGDRTRLTIVARFTW